MRKRSCTAILACILVIVGMTVWIIVTQTDYDTFLHVTSVVNCMRNELFTLNRITIKMFDVQYANLALNAIRLVLDIKKYIFEKERMRKILTPKKKDEPFGTNK